MILTTVLRLGNYIRHNPYLGEKDEVAQVTLITYRGINVTGGISYSIYSVDPIPITEEWLLRFGFQSDAYNDRYYNAKMEISCNKTTGTLLLWEIVNGVELKYVHQLQNLYFALTGEELIYYENRD